MALIHQVRFGFGLFLFGFGIIITTSSVTYMEILGLLNPLTRNGSLNAPFGSPGEWFTLGVVVLLAGTALIQYSFREEVKEK